MAAAKRALPPLGIFTKRSPYAARIKSVAKIADETYHIVLDHGGKIPFWEGQCYGILPPGNDSIRMYSIACSRYGEDLDSNTASLCVKRHDRGICSNFICDSKPGDQLNVTGPLGTKLLFRGFDDPDASHIMVATGTGIAPFRGFIQRMFDGPWKFGGTAWLFQGSKDKSSLLYASEMQAYANKYSSRFTYDSALSRESLNTKGGKMYVQDKIEKNGDQLVKLLDKGAHIYLCGCKDMVPGVQTALQNVIENNGRDWEGWFSSLKKSRQWHTEAY